MRKTELTNSALCEAVAEMVRGLVDADLGGGVVKKRVALPGRGKSGGARTGAQLDLAVQDSALEEICHDH